MKEFSGDTMISATDFFTAQLACFGTIHLFLMGVQCLSDKACPAHLDTALQVRYHVGQGLNIFT